MKGKYSDLGKDPVSSVGCSIGSCHEDRANQARSGKNDGGVKRGRFHRCWKKEMPLRAGGTV